MKTMKITTVMLAVMIMLFGLVGIALAAHPDIHLKDVDGNWISSAGGLQPAFSFKQTCSGCHNYQEIEQHSYHTQVSANQFVGWNVWNPDSASKFKKGPAAKGKNWVQSPGHFGKW